MLSAESREQYRQMSPAQRLRLALSMLRDNERFLLIGSAEQVRRKFELMAQQNDARNRAMLEKLARARRRDS